MYFISLHASKFDGKSSGMQSSMKIFEAVVIFSVEVG